MSIWEKKKTENLCSKYSSQEVGERITGYVQRKPKRGNNKYESRNSVKNKTGYTERSTKSKLVILKDQQNWWAKKNWWTIN